MFRLNACWTKDKEFTEVINNSWKEESRHGDPWERYHGKIHRCKKIKNPTMGKKKRMGLRGVSKRKDKGVTEIAR